MVQTMTTDDDNQPEYDDADDDTGTESLDKETVQGWIREALSDLKPSDEPSPSSDDAEPLTIKAIEAAARRAVEDAMKPLREAATKKQPAKRKPAPKPEPEPEASPAKGSPSRLRAFMWGGSDD